MSMDNESVDQQPAVESEIAPTPGQAIRRARTRARLDIEDLASQIKLPVALLVALEADDFATLQEPVYVRGYYRKCARALAMDEAALLASYAARVLPVTPRLPTKLRLAGGEERSGLSTGKLAVFAPLVAVVVVGGFWYFNGQRSTTFPHMPVAASGLSAPSSLPPLAPAKSAPGPGTLSAGPADPGPAAGESASPGLPPSALAGPSAMQALPPPPAAADAGADAGAVPPAGALAREDAINPASDTRLVLEFVGTSWARIEDSRGNVLLNRVAQKGERLALDGAPPYSLFLGYAPGVQVRYKGQAVDTATYTRPSATARFSVPAG